jgi:hypothetical protein
MTASKPLQGGSAGTRKVRARVRVRSDQKGKSFGAKRPR